MSKVLFRPFVNARNLRDPDLLEGAPWDFAPERTVLDSFRSMPKEVRREKMNAPETDWSIYTAVIGIAPSQRVSKQNAPSRMRGLVADYDRPLRIEQVRDYLKKLSPELLPNFIEVTLSRNVRLVWVFEREVLIPNPSFCRNLIKELFGRIGVPQLLPGYDPSSEKPEQVWTNGGEWHALKESPLSWEILSGMICDASKKTEFGDEDVPLEVIFDRIQAKYPGRWQGPFELNAVGVRFWDETADCPSGCQVKPDGMLCFTGKTPFMTWAQIFGAAWVKEQTYLNLGKAAGEIYYDGRSYWEFKLDCWTPVNRMDVVLRLKAKGISAKIPIGSGDTLSPAECVLNYIQNYNYVRGAAPLINQKSGIVNLDGERILNISTIRALEPATGPATIEDFPWLWEFLNGLFDRVEEGSLNHFLAWLQRAYSAAYHYRKAMGQAVFLCGPKQNGKTLLCFQVIKPLLGNKIANPYDYFTGATTFNDDLFDSPLLAINDEEATVRDESRQKFIARIKSFVVNPSHTYHPKFSKRFNIEWTGRIFITLNDDPASVGLLPEVNGNTADKLMFFASRPYKRQWDSNEVTESRIARELPFFARWLLDWSPPGVVLIPGRMGVESFFDKRILELSRQQMPAYALIEMLNVWINETAAWEENGPDKEKARTKEFDPTQLHGCLSSVECLVAPMRGWNVTKMAHALRTLSQLQNSGVELVPDSRERRYKFIRELIVKSNLQHSA